MLQKSVWRIWVLSRFLRLLLEQVLQSHWLQLKDTSLVMSVLPGVVSRCFGQRSVKPVCAPSPSKQASKPTTHLPNQCLLRPIPAETLPNQLVKLELHLPLPS